MKKIYTKPDINVTKFNNADSTNANLLRSAVFQQVPEGVGSQYAKDVFDF